MAKNKNRKQAGRPELSQRLEGVGSAPTARAGARQPKSAVAEARTDSRTESAAGPAQGARTKQRRFGHN